MPLKVIGAGLGRTGTMSLKYALEQLGFGPCHHMIELIGHPEQFKTWERVFDDEPLDWEDVYAGYNSAVDAPTCFVYRALAERYPGAKVILTVRDPESWWRSASATVMANFRQADEQSSGQQDAEQPMVKMQAKLAGYLARRGSPRGRPTDHDGAIAQFERHNAEVRRVIAPERLLVYEVKQGWAPLCAFLGVPVPGAPFPHSNTTEEFLTRVRDRLPKEQTQ
jgi:Sulfotransferase domain